MTCLLGNEVNELRNNLVMKLFGDWLLSQIETLDISRFAVREMGMERSTLWILEILLR